MSAPQDNAPERYQPPAPTPPVPARPAANVSQVRPRPVGTKRSSAEIRRDIEIRRQELGRSVEALRDQVAYLTDWRGHVRRHKKPLAIAAAATGFAIGGIVAAALKRR